MANRTRHRNSLFESVKNNVVEMSSSTMLSSDSNDEIDTSQNILSSNKEISSDVYELKPCAIFKREPQLKKSDREQLDQLSNYQTENARLFNENSILTDKLATALIEIEDLKQQLTTNSNSTTENLSTVYIDTINSLSTENINLKNKISALEANILNLRHNLNQPYRHPQTIRENNTLQNRLFNIQYKTTHDGYSNWN